MEIDDKARSCEWIANYQRVGGDTKRTLWRRNEGSKGVVIKDGGEINEIKKKLDFFKAKKQKSGQYKGKDMSIAKKNLEQPKKKTPKS